MLPSRENLHLKKHELLIRIHLVSEKAQDNLYLSHWTGILAIAQTTKQ